MARTARKRHIYPAKNVILTDVPNIAKSVSKAVAVLSSKVAIKSLAPKKNQKKIEDIKSLEDVKSTADIAVSNALIDQVIGQERAINVIRKASSQKRNVLLVGTPGTGKSMLAQAMAELMPIEELSDILVYANRDDDNVPKIKTMKAGEGRKMISSERMQTRMTAGNSNMMMMGFMMLSMLIGLYILPKYFDSVIVAAMLIGVFLMSAALMFAMQLGRGRMFDASDTAKLIVDNTGKKNAPFVDACLLPGQKVFTLGTPTKIEETKGMLVYNSKGESQKVEDVQLIPYDGNIFKIKPRLLPEFTATPNHPFLVLERPATKQFKLREFTAKKRLNDLESSLKWKPAKELNEGDMLIYPELKQPTIYASAQMGDNGNGTTQLLQIDEEMALALGWYLAEGYYRKEKGRNTVGFTLGHTEKSEAAEIARILEKRFGANVKYDLHHKSSIGLVIYSKHISEFFSRHFPGDATTKAIPDFIFNSPITVKKSFLKGYFAGDGYETKDTLSVATASKELADDLVFLFSSMGLFPTCHERQMKNSIIKGRVVKGAYIYEFNLHGKQLKKLGKSGSSFQHYFTYKNLNFIPIRKIQQVRYQGSIINMETTDGTYLMPCITHNTGSRAGALLGDVKHDPFQSFEGKTLVELNGEKFPLEKLWDDYSQKYPIEKGKNGYEAIVLPRKDKSKITASKKGKKVSAKLLIINRRPYEGKLIEIKSGKKKLLTTPEHAYISNPSVKKARNLRKGTKVYVSN
ncbi:MAG: LAGLIDADG family homing endonuclease [Candidatus Micrarchaeota archaeon]